MSNTLPDPVPDPSSVPGPYPPLPRNSMSPESPDPRLDEAWFGDERTPAPITPTKADSISSTSSRRASPNRCAMHVGKLHQQVRIAHGEWTDEVDEEIAPLILALWRAGMHTTRSCQAHMTGKAWVEFRDSHDVERFLDFVVPPDASAGSMWHRAKSQLFGIWGEKHDRCESNAWEYYIDATDRSFDEGRRRLVGPNNGWPNFLLAVSVLIPHRDLRDVTNRMQAHSASAKTATVD